MSIWNKMLASLTHTRVLCIFTIYNGDDGSSTIIFIEPIDFVGPVCTGGIFLLLLLQ